MLNSVNGTFCSLDTLRGLKIEHPENDGNLLEQDKRKGTWGGNSWCLTRKKTLDVIRKNTVVWIYKQDEKGGSSMIGEDQRPHLPPSTSLIMCESPPFRINDLLSLLRLFKPPPSPTISISSYPFFLINLHDHKLNIVSLTRQQTWMMPLLSHP